MSLKNILKTKVNSRVVVVMTDGRYLRGIIRVVEDGLLVLDNVEETSSQDVEWKQKVDILSGRHIWSRIELPEVYINLGYIARVWPWPEVDSKSPAEEKHIPEKSSTNKPKVKFPEDRNVYFREVGVM